PQGNATSGLGFNKHRLQNSVYDVLINDLPAEKIISDTSIACLHLLPSTIQLAGAEIELVALLTRESKLKQGLASVADQYDFVLIDCPPSLGLLTINALTAAEAVLIPIQCEFYALEGVSQLVSTIGLVQKALNSRLAIEGVLLTMYDSRTNLSQQVADEVRTYFRDKVFRTVVPRNVRLSEAPSHGQPIITYDRRSRGSEVYFGLAREVVERN
ncbi:MAG: ParA family protein, partial [Negativicutes bacterium]|nr:ParA family protein [Negativicutes bacterium]